MHDYEARRNTISVKEHQENVLEELTEGDEFELDALSYNLYEICVVDDKRSVQELILTIQREGMSIRDIGFRENNIIVDVQGWMYSK